MVVIVATKDWTAQKNATKITLGEIAMTSATQLVETATKRVVYVITDVNQDGKDFIVKMPAMVEGTEKTVAYHVETVWSQHSVITLTEHV